MQMQPFQERGRNTNSIVYSLGTGIPPRVAGLNVHCLAAFTDSFDRKPLPLSARALRTSPFSSTVTTTVTVCCLCVNPLISKTGDTLRSGSGGTVTCLGATGGVGAVTCGYGMPIVVTGGAAGTWAAETGLRGDPAVSSTDAGVGGCGGKGAGGRLPATSVPPSFVTALACTGALRGVSAAGAGNRATADI